MATTFGSSSIVINGKSLGQNAQDYELGVRWHLDLISRSQTGAALLRAMQRSGRGLLIQPWPNTNINADTTPKNSRNATAQGELVLPGAGPFNYKAKGSFRDTNVGTGEGSDVVIRYATNMFGYGGSAQSTFAPTLPGIGPSAVLFHEMAHAYRDMAGHQYRGPMVGARVGYDNEEEFFAIVLSNIFVTDPTTQVQNRALRADHWGFKLLATAQSTSKGFLQVASNKRLIGRLSAQEPELSSDLLNVGATFNPILEYYRPATH